MLGYVIRIIKLGYRIVRFTCIGAKEKANCTVTWNYRREQQNVEGVTEIDAPQRLAQCKVLA